ncbi:hypothetical protein [Demequina rhizosphaerae]|uniref:hypothetical protein n=1 Tax=Demequina rhizosphaerae TaxID=1638985 RepID=UPI0007806DDC|nr:hypothetical protein [Demequina rhizosphaerae]
MTVRYLVRQRITLMVNRYEVWRADEGWNPVEQLAFAQQKRGRLREEVPFYTDESKTHVRFTLQARNILDVNSVVDVRDEAAAVVGGFRKDFRRSLLVTTWYMEQEGLPRVLGQETSTLYAVLRRIGFDLLPYDFLFATEDAGSPVMTIVRKWGVRDTYRVTVEDDRYDPRLIHAVAVGLDALQNR